MRISISTKITGALVLITVAVGTILALLAVNNIENLTNNEFTKITDNLIRQQAVAIAHTIDSTIVSMDQLTNKKMMQEMVDRNIKNHGSDFMREMRIHVPDSSSKNGYRCIAGTVGVGKESDPPDIQAIKNNKIVLENDKSTTAMGEDLLEATVPLHVNGKAVATAGVILSISKVRAEQTKVLVQKRNEIIRQFQIVTLLTVLMAILIGYLISRKLTSAIKHFTDVAEKLSLGDLNVSPHVESNDEVGRLSEAFERLVTALKFFMNPDDSERKVG